jgi:hypothetical protein
MHMASILALSNPTVSVLEPHFGDFPSAGRVTYFYTFREASSITFSITLCRL